MAIPTSIVVVGDHNAVRKGVTSYLQILPDFEVVGVAASGEDALALVSELVPEIVLLDLSIPGTGVVEIVRRTKQMSPRTQVVILTSTQDDALFFSALKSGAFSYILKNVKMEQFADMLRRAVEGEVILYPGVATCMLQGICSEQNNKQTIFMKDLTSRELNILKLIANGLTNHQIAEKLIISDNVVIGHVSNILMRMHFAAAFEMHLMILT